MSLTVLDPTNDATVADAMELAPRRPSLTGSTLGVLGNGKPNSDVLLAALVRQLGPGIEVIRHRKPAIGRLAPDEMISELVETCDVVVTGVGDCSGCCTCSAHDAVTLERHGVPTAMVCTREFLDAARTVARALGLSRYPFTVISHPFGSLTRAEVERTAAACVDHVTWALTDTEPGSAPASPASLLGPAVTGGGVSCAC